MLDKGAYTTEEGTEEGLELTEHSSVCTQGGRHHPSTLSVAIANYLRPDSLLKTRGLFGS